MAALYAVHVQTAAVLLNGHLAGGVGAAAQSALCQELLELDVRALVQPDPRLVLCPLLV